MEHPDWPQLFYNIKTLLSQLTPLNRLIGAPEIPSGTLAGDELFNAREKVLTDDVLETSVIEGAILLDATETSTDD